MEPWPPVALPCFCSFEVDWGIPIVVPSFPAFPLSRFSAPARQSLQRHRVAPPKLIQF
jgi:hypothetical protein